MENGVGLLVCVGNEGRFVREIDVFEGGGCAWLLVDYTL